VQVQAGPEGIDLTAANYCLFFSKDFSLGRYRQCKKRLHRPGQTRKTFYYHIIAQNTVDVQIMKAIKNKQDIVDYILEELNPHRLKN
jgi:SNF2 family DNA or RNA helicase